MTAYPYKGIYGTQPLGALKSQSGPRPMPGKERSRLPILADQDPANELSTLFTSVVMFWPITS
jgi:hypothetical protein